MLYVLRSQVSGLSFGHVDKLACGLCSNAFGASSFIGIRDIDACYHSVDGLCPPVCAECLVPSLSVVIRDHEVTTMG